MIVTDIYPTELALLSTYCAGDVSISGPKGGSDSMYTQEEID
jgi:hypothetical protein